MYNLMEVFCMRLLDESLLHETCGLEKHYPILVGVSGGPDSVYLWLRLLELGFVVVVAHFDHGLRPDSAADAMWVSEQAHRLNCRFVLGQAEVETVAEKEGLSLEDAARRMRYRFLFESAQAYACQAVAVGHTADDQVETVLLHLLRGSGLRGLGGMRYRTFLEEYSTTIPLVRPILGIWRKDIERYLAEREISYRQDMTNRDLRFLRNRVRHRLIPTLETYNPQIRRHLWQMAYSLQADYEIVEREVQVAWLRCLDEESPNYVTLKRAEYCAEIGGIRARLIRLAVERFTREQRGSNFASTERVVKFIQSGYPGQVEMEGGVQVVLDSAHIYVFPRGEWPVKPLWPLISPQTTLRIEVPDQLALGEGWILETFLSSSQEMFASVKRDPFIAYLDAAVVRIPLVLRTRRPGDRFWPYGMEGPMRLSDFLVNVRLPRWVRDRWPLLFSDDVLVWVPGLRIAHPCRVTPSTQEVVVLKLYRSA